MEYGMKKSRSLPLRLLILQSIAAFVMVSMPLASGQAPVEKSADKTDKPPPPVVLKGDDAKRAEELAKAIEAALKADRWYEAIARAEELFALRTRVQGPKHFETVNAEWRSRRCAAWPRCRRRIESPTNRPRP